jgi:hypothetical protein
MPVTLPVAEEKKTRQKNNANIPRFQANRRWMPVRCSRKRGRISVGDTER